MTDCLDQVDIWVCLWGVILTVLINSFQPVSHNFHRGPISDILYIGYLHYTVHYSYEVATKQSHSWGGHHTRNCIKESQC